MDWLSHGVRSRRRARDDIERKVKAREGVAFAHANEAAVKGRLAEVEALMAQKVAAGGELTTIDQVDLFFARCAHESAQRSAGLAEAGLL